MVKKGAYWATTVLFSGLMVMSAVMYLTQNPKVMEGIQTIGIPYFFIQLLGVAKLLGALALLYPRFKKMTDWAYAGFTFTLIGAAWTHVATHTYTSVPMVGIAAVFLAVSYAFQDQNLFRK